VSGVPCFGHPGPGESAVDVCRWGTDHGSLPQAVWLVTHLAKYLALCPTSIALCEPPSPAPTRTEPRPRAATRAYLKARRKILSRIVQLSSTSKAFHRSEVNLTDLVLRKSGQPHGLKGILPPYPVAQRFGSMTVTNRQRQRTRLPVLGSASCRGTQGCRCHAVGYGGSVQYRIIRTAFPFDINGKITHFVRIIPALNYS
jgi:hypothetical protein